MVEHNQSKYYKVPYPTTNTGSYDNKWKFNGKELDDATGMYYYGARYYDPRISIFVSVDPLAESTFEPYSYVGNNPIMFTDPTGMSKNGVDGDYYSRSGQYLGSDGKKDNRVYVADSVTKNKEGVVTEAQNANELPMSHSKFQTTSAIVKHEGVTNDSDEYLWIAHTANNNAKESNSNLYSKLMSGYSSVAKADKVPLSTGAKSQTALFARAAVIDVLSGGIDPTGGATLWDGTDLLAWGLNSPDGTPHNKFEEYNRIVIPGDIYCKFLENTLQKYRSGSVPYYGTKYSLPEGVFNNLSNWKEGNFDFSPGNKEPKSLRATGTRGRSVFWKTIK